MKRFIMPLLLSLTLSSSTYASDADLKYCDKDEDCAQAQCCHTDGYVNKKYAPSCEGTMCTMDCSGPYDCVGAIPKCVDHQCTGSADKSSTALPTGAMPAVR